MQLRTMTGVSEVLQWPTCLFSLSGSFKPDDGPVHGVIMHPREYFDNVTKRVTNLFNVRKGESDCFCE